ncbi:hypothetical protein [Pseudomonas sp. p99-361]|uniref:hypothetical protein n=1 Tax=Pseudomonas sp. p99-361 TaxID=2479852 RepID=UPI000F78CE32|nr:hypothetical protein [Pseudomonas sp. p99-361]
MPTENRSSNTEMVSVTRYLAEEINAALINHGHVALPRRLQEAMNATCPQPHPEPIAWMVGTAFWWTKEEAERDAEATGLPIVGLGPMTGADEAERLRDVVKHSDNQIMRQSLRISNQRTQLADRLALLREALEFIDDGVGRSDAEWRLIKKLRAALSPDGAAGASDEPYQGMPGTSFQRLNALANQGE